MDPDVIVIGAGAAGLACIQRLRKAGVRVACLEARQRIGGRICTIHEGFPVEFGAEFVHGRAPQILELTQVEECGGRMIRVWGGRVTEDDEAEGGPVLEDVKRAGSAGPDESLQQFLDRSSYSEEHRQEATGFAEGFNAARKEELSVASLAKDMIAGDQIDGDRTFRVRGGYEVLLRALGEPDVRLGAVVESVIWRQGDCRVRLAGGEELRAPRVVVTVPLGVLQAGAIRFDPEPAGILEAARALRFGQAFRVTLRFERAFWEDAAGFRDAGFIITDEPVFPVWWTRSPSREPVLTGWSAGPKGDALIGLPADEVTAQALSALQRIVGRKTPEITGKWFHDWHADPFARGAYSWVPAGALPSREVLARPVEQTLYFAGEATDLAGYGGTVHGALESGYRAARQILSDAGPRPGAE